MPLAACTSVANAVTVACSNTTNSLPITCEPGFYVNGTTCAPCSLPGNATSAVCTTENDSQATACVVSTYLSNGQCLRMCILCIRTRWPCMVLVLQCGDRISIGLSKTLTVIRIHTAACASVMFATGVTCTGPGVSEPTGCMPGTYVNATQCSGVSYSVVVGTLPGNREYAG
jgi:hypothetical protein